MNIVMDSANRISERYRAIPDDYLCRRICWDEIDDSFAEFQQEINDQAHGKSCIYLFRTEMYDYPIPFWVKRNGMWGTWAYRDNLYEGQYAEKCMDTCRCQIRYGSGRIRHSIFMNDDFLEEMRYAGTQYVLMTDCFRDAQNLNRVFESQNGEPNLIKLFAEQFDKEDRLVVLDLCEGQFVFDRIESSYTIRAEEQKRPKE